MRNLDYSSCGAAAIPPTARHAQSVYAGQSKLAKGSRHRIECSASTCRSLASATFVWVFTVDYSVVTAGQQTGLQSPWSSITGLTCRRSLVLIWANFFLSNVVRTWHLQLCIFWVANLVPCRRYLLNPDDLRPRAARTEVPRVWFIGRSGRCRCGQSAWRIRGNPGADS